MSVPSNREHHYQNLRDRYTNCTYVDGNLELTWLQDKNMDLSFLQDIREVTGYVLISHVDVKKIVIPNLQIIRGRTLFKLNVRDEEFALMVTLSKMENLEMPALRGKHNIQTLLPSYTNWFSSHSSFPLLQHRRPSWIGWLLQQLQPLPHQDNQLGGDPFGS